MTKPVILRIIIECSFVIKFVIDRLLDKAFLVRVWTSLYDLPVKALLFVGFQQREIDISRSPFTQTVLETAASGVGNLILKMPIFPLLVTKDLTYLWHRYLQWCKCINVGNMSLILFVLDNHFTRFPWLVFVLSYVIQLQSSKNHYQDEAGAELHSP